MDLQEIKRQARMLLQTATRYGGSPVESNAIIDLHHDGSQSWRQDVARARLNTRALDLLLRAKFLDRDPASLAVVVSDAGHSFLNLDDSAELPLSDESLQAWVEREEFKEALDGTVRISANTFGYLQVSSWRQFANVEIIFHPRLTILTGANATGKTTLLNLLAPHFNWQAQLLVRSGPTGSNGATEGAVGSLTYSNGTTAQLIQPPALGIQNAPLRSSNQQAVPGIFINSHRSVSSYQPLAALLPKFSETEVILSQFSSEIYTRYAGGGSQFSPLYKMKEALYAAAIYAYGNQAVRPDPVAQEVWEGFQLVLGKVMPDSLGFTKLEADQAEIILVTEASSFPIEAVSGGLSAILELSWQIFLRSRNQESFTVCLDEPENHLHPELQRTILPNLLAAFPDVSFIVATHSPFVVTSAREASVYALARADDDNKVSARLVDTVNFAATSDETLSGVLGLDSVLPVWAENEVDDLLAAISDNPSVEELRHLREGLEQLGLGRQFPAAVRSIGGGAAK